MARKPWCRVLYWFAMLIDAERIDREIRGLDSVNEAELGAVGQHDPERLPRLRDEILARLRGPLSDEQIDTLIAYAMQRQQEVNKGLVS